MQVVSTKAIMQAVAKTGGMSAMSPSRRGSAGTITLSSTTRDRLWVSPGFSSVSLILAPPRFSTAPALSVRRSGGKPAHCRVDGTQGLFCH